MGERKVKLTIDEMIVHMRDKNIRFTIVSEDEAKQFLQRNNYFFKIKSYAKNFEKYRTGEEIGKYIDVDFAYLIELSTLDMYIRKILLNITLDIEHFLKVNLLADLAVNDKEDGYTIIEELFDTKPHIVENLQRQTRNSMGQSLIEKYREQFAAWNIVEVLSFGDFLFLYELYYAKYEERLAVRYVLRPVKFLRNAAAHNSCLLHQFREGIETDNINRTVNTFVSKINNIGKEERKKKMKNRFIHDFVCTLYVFHQVASESVKMHTFQQLKTLLEERFRRNQHYFAKNELLCSYYRFIYKIVDFFIPTIIK